MQETLPQLYRLLVIVTVRVKHWPTLAHSFETVILGPTTPRATAFEMQAKSFENGLEDASRCDFDNGKGEHACTAWGFRVSPRGSGIPTLHAAGCGMHVAQP